jgi:glycosyltransferase involved in cell wall biosynthesis
MMTLKPKISVILICYNHEDFISEAIESILNQTYSDFELIIIDDNSTDNTLKCAREYADPRITILQQYHTGPSISINEGIQRSRGDYLAFMSGDDVSLEHRLESQIHQIELHNSDIIFSLPLIIDSDSELLESGIFTNFFGKQFRTNSDLYRILFYQGNFLCAPSCFCRREIFEKTGYFKRGLIQLQDFDFWLRACKAGLKIKLFSDPLIKYRFLEHNNLSDISTHQNRIRIELSHIYDSFFEDISNELFQNSFEDDPCLEPYISLDKIEIKGALLSLYHPEPIVKMVGAKKIINFLEHDSLYDKLITLPDFSMSDFFLKEDHINITNIDPEGAIQAQTSSPAAKRERIRLRITSDQGQARKLLQKCLDEGNYDEAIAIIRGMYIIYPEETKKQTLIKIFSKFWSIPQKIIAKIKSIINFKTQQAEISDLQVYEIQSLWDFCKKNQCIIHEDEHETVFINKPEILGTANNTNPKGYAKCPKPYISKIDNVIVTGGSDYVITEDKKLLNDELACFPGKEFGIKSPYVKFRHENKIILGYLKRPPIIINEGILISCGHDYNYFHWMIENLPKVLFIDQFPEMRKFPLLIPKNLHKNFENALEKINVFEHPIIRLTDGMPYQVKQLIFPGALSRVVDRYEGELEFDKDIVLSKQWIRLLSRMLKSYKTNNQAQTRKIFLTRRKGLRELENRPDIEAFFLNKGFEIIELDNVSLQFQIDLFSQAKVIVSPTGATLTNMLFCEPGTKVFIFMSDHKISNYYFWTQLGNILNLDVRIILGQRLYNLTSYYEVHDDYRIVNKQLEKIIDN